MTAKDIIKKNFSRHAAHYDKHARLQEKCGRELLLLSGKEEFKNILDLGCGTGLYTGLLRKRFPLARIKAIDISEEMVRVARSKFDSEGVEFIAGDAEELSFARKFDLITSNASFQWFADLEKAFFKYNGMLKRNGVMLFSTFGPGTFRELNLSLKIFFGEKLSTSSSLFKEREEIEKMLRVNFCNATVTEKLYFEEHDSLPEFLEKIKYSGVRGYGAEKKGFWTANAVRGLEEIYRKEFPGAKPGGIKATYQALFARGEK